MQMYPNEHKNTSKRCRDNLAAKYRSTVNEILVFLSIIIEKGKDHITKLVLPK